MKLSSHLGMSFTRTYAYAFKMLRHSSLLLVICFLCSMIVNVECNASHHPSHPSKKCTPALKAKNTRREWFEPFLYYTIGYLQLNRATLTKPERRHYIDAILCLQSLPSKLGDVPGARTRYDDFAAVHINHTLSIHMSGLFLGWHREFVWLFENTLRVECGFEGSLPCVISCQLREIH